MRYYDKWSSVHHVKNWKTPTLVIHGEKDYRLPVTEGLSTFTCLQRQNIPSKLLYFPDESNSIMIHCVDHWVLKHANVIFWYNEMIQWLNTWTLKPDHVPQLTVQKN